MAHYLPDKPINAPPNPIIPEDPNVQYKGIEAQPFEVPPGPAWRHDHPANAGGVSNLNEFPMPKVVLEAMVAAGYIKSTDRSDREEVKHGVRRIIDAHIKQHIIDALNRDAVLRSKAESSWGVGPR